MATIRSNTCFKRKGERRGIYVVEFFIVDLRAHGLHKKTFPALTSFHINKASSRERGPAFMLNQIIPFVGILHVGQPIRQTAFFFFMGLPFSSSEDG